ncbi:methionyl-tRNA formyltransferase [Polynucleobacter sp. MWH-UH2A]|uniref:methionyl-tRNA formyltransferase n=1 Tax=Polynucleobacter sp. MWH-UH2A TaxID=1855617 RepID=UPI001BFE6B3D|nr:methionyl-tRNA formyltransferase [Polynucleobacter sp. MWH-UH2A]QWD64060.1 methionyl-tRNA formyltransferase [Polynucleobacter sp. MWH-UH2A]
MKIVFAGTPEFAAQAMRAIDEAGHEIVLVLTQPDRRAGRGMHLQASPVKQFAIAKNIPVLQPETLRRNVVDPQKKIQAEDAYKKLLEIDFDAMVVVAYGLILPQEILDISERTGRHGSFNIHASLLPRWRGAAPIQRAIESGDSKTGVCIMQMDAGLDAGDTVMVEEFDIHPNETSASLHDRLAALGAKLIVKTLDQLERSDQLQRSPQASQGITYAEKITKDEAEVDWSKSAQEIDARIRAFNPFPGASSSIGYLTFKLWDSRIPKETPSGERASAGQVLGFSNESVFVKCGTGVIEILEMQKPGGKRIQAKLCLQGLCEVGEVLRFQVKENSRS